MKHIFLTLALAALTTTAIAHHGRDFILVEDHTCPAPGGMFLLGNFEWEKGNEGSEYGFSPSLMVGVLPQLSLSIEASFREEVGADWKYASVTPSAHIQLTPADSKSPVRFGLSASYQFAEGEEADHHAEEEEAEGHHHHGSSIHNHDDNALIARFITEADLGDFKAVLNIINVTPDEGSTAWGYAVGVRCPVCDTVSLGVEALGDFASDGWQEFGPAAYIEPIHNLTLKLGISFGLTEETPDFSVRTGIVYRF